MCTGHGFHSEGEADIGHSWSVTTKDRDPGHPGYAFPEKPEEDVRPTAEVHSFTSLHISDNKSCLNLILM